MAVMAALLDTTGDHEPPESVPANLYHRPQIIVDGEESLESMTAKSSLTAMLIGEFTAPEFRPVRASLQASMRLLLASTSGEAISQIAAGSSVPDLMVICQARPGECSAEQVGHLRSLAPLAPVVTVLGSWCEGETRTGTPWPGTVRMFWHQWPARSQQSLSRMICGQCADWGRPATTTDEERLTQTVGESPAQRGGPIAICSRHFEVADALAGACQAWGYTTVWLRPDHVVPLHGIRAALWDGRHIEQQQELEISRLARCLAEAPVLALLGFPRIEDQQRALAAGAHAILARPLMIEDLRWHLDHALASSGQDRPDRPHIAA